VSHKIYDSARWRKLRRLKLQYAKNLCEVCLRHGRVEIAEVVDHVTPINAGGDPYPALKDLSALCIPHHNMKTRAEQLGKPFNGDPVIAMNERGCDESGQPFDKAHAWWRDDGSG
jgi:5-methylcytosine-specific restriction enzyme A